MFQECSALSCSAYVELNTVRETRAICVWVHGVGGAREVGERFAIKVER